MLQGRVIKAYNSFFYVQTDMGLVTCKLRGKFKKFRQELGVVPGDWVSLDALPDGTGVIEEVQPRIQLLKRPAVANLTQVVLTFAAAQPDLHPLLLNRFLVLAEWSGMDKILICVNKIDLFAGIGGFRIAMQNLGGKCVYSSEFSQSAVWPVIDV